MNFTVAAVLNPLVPDAEVVITPKIFGFRHQIFAVQCGQMKSTLFTFLVGIPTANRSTNRSLFKDPKLWRLYTTTSNFDSKDYISICVSGTKVNIVGVFNYEFSTTMLTQTHLFFTRYTYIVLCLFYKYIIFTCVHVIYIKLILSCSASETILLGLIKLPLI